MQLKLISAADLLPPMPAGVPPIEGLPAMGDAGVPLGDIPEPPAATSMAGIRDMLTVQQMQARRTAAGDAWAVRMATDGEREIWQEFAKRHRATTGRAQGWLDSALLASVLSATASASLVAKNRFDRKRPFQIDPRIIPPFKLPRTSSYPSGHASSAFAAARVIGAFAPTLAAEAWELACQVATSRVYAGVHFPSDVIMGAKLGIAVADDLIRRRGITMPTPQAA